VLYRRPGPFFGHPGWLELLSWLVPLLLVGALVALAVLAVLRLTGRREPPAWGGREPPAWGAPPGWQAQLRQDAALEAARLRYARGELDRDQYLRLVADLGGQPPPGPGEPQYAPGEPPPGP
jgi:hypothetical protein